MRQLAMIEPRVKIRISSTDLLFITKQQSEFNT